MKKWLLAQIKKRFACDIKVFEWPFPHCSSVKLTLFKTNYLLNTYRKVLTVNIIQYDINYWASKRSGWHNPCPITEKLRLLFPNEYIIVNGIGIHIGKKYQTPESVKKFIVDWDSKREVEPFGFELEL